MESRRIVVLGSGNVASHLARALSRENRIVQIWSRDLGHATELAQALPESQAISQLEAIDPTADFYLISVSDDAIHHVAQALTDVQGIVAHTSGSVGLEALSPVPGPKGVFYPLQTFSKGVDVDISKVPFFLEASSAEAMLELEAMAKSISEIVHHADSAQRKTLHIAAVISSNFFNHLLGISSRLLEADGYPLTTLRPLLEVTLDKAMRLTPDAAQTGPAARGDMEVIKHQREALEGTDREIYEIITKAIMERRQS